MIVSDITGVRRTVKRWLDGIENNLFEGDTKRFLDQLTDHDRMIYIAGMKWALKSIQSITG